MLHWWNIVPYNGQVYRYFSTRNPFGPSSYPDVAAIYIYENGSVLSCCINWKYTKRQVLIRFQRDFSKQLLMRLLQLCHCYLRQLCIKVNPHPIGITHWLLPYSKKVTCMQAVNYRSISLTSIVSKCFEDIVHHHIMLHVDELGMLHDAQHGFRRKRRSV